MSATRRGFVGAAAGFGALGALGGIAGCAAAARGGTEERAVSGGDILIRDAFVMTMDPSRGDVPGADVLVRGGEIAAVGTSVDAPAGATVIEGRDMIVLPGFVETHWHLWTTVLRSMSGDRPEHGYFPTSRGIGVHYTPADMYRSAKLGAAEAIHSGITFVHDWCHNVRGPEFARADLAALRDAGLRARFSYGLPTAPTADDTVDLDDLARLHEEWSEHSAGGLLDLGLAWRGVAGGAVDAAARREYAAARELGLPISVHANNASAAAGGIAVLARDGLLGPHVQVIHAIWTTQEEVDAMASTGTSISLSPYTELRIGFGLPTTSEFLAAGIRVGLSVDTPTLSGNADMFAIMKTIQNVANGRAQDEFRLPARRVLELATIDGARSMGLDRSIGSLVPGKRADLIMIDTRHVNLAVFTDPAHLLVEAAQPANVDTVIIDGRIVKRDGRLTSLDVGEIVADARETNALLRERSGWW
jgi:5-methylthioadenosine/S-adenosylhomocysteine deaminase